MLIGDDFLPRELTEAEQAALNACLKALSRALEDECSKAIQWTRLIEKTYRVTCGSGGTLKDWLTLPVGVPWRWARTAFGQLLHSKKES